MTGIISSLNPRPGLKVEDTDVVQPCVVKVLTSDDEQFVSSYGRQVGITSARNVGFWAWLEGRSRNPASGREIKEMDVIENTEVVCVLGFRVIGHSTEYNEVIVP